MKYDAVSTEELADRIAAHERAISRAKDAVTFMRDILRVRMASEATIKLKTPHGTRAEFRERFARTPSQRRLARLLGPYLYVKGKAISDE